LRIEFPGAIYPVSSRMLGSWQQSRDQLFEDKRDRERFLQRLSEGVTDFGIRLYLFTLIPLPLGPGDTRGESLPLHAEPLHCLHGVFQQQVVFSSDTLAERSGRQLNGWG